MAFIPYEDLVTKKGFIPYEDLTPVKQPQAAEPATGLINQPPPAESGAAFTPISRNLMAQGKKIRELHPETGPSRLSIGIQNTETALRLAATYDQKEIAKLVAESARRTPAETPVQAEMRAEIAPYVKEVKDTEGFASSVWPWAKLAAKQLSLLVSNPEEAMGMVVENLPNSAPGMAGAIVGGKVGLAAGAAGGPAVAGWTATAGALFGGTVSGYAIEQGAAMQEQILKEAQKRGVDSKDPEALAPIIAENYEKFLRASRLKGVGTAATDALLTRLTFGVAGMGEKTLVRETRAVAEGVRTGTLTTDAAALALDKLAARELARNTITARAARGGGIVGMEMGGESLSEATGQMLAYGEVDPLDVVNEGLLAVGQGGLIAASRKVVGPLLGTGSANQVGDTLKATRQFVGATDIYGGFAVSGAEASANAFAKALQADTDSAAFVQSNSERAALAAMDPRGPSVISPNNTRLPIDTPPPAPPAGGAAATPGDQWAAGKAIAGAPRAPNVTAAGGLLDAIESTVMDTATVDEAIDAATKAATQLTPNYAPFAETPGVTDTFRTARGSTYALFDDNTTQRNRAGEGADTGLQPRSGATVFMDDMLIDKIGKVIQNEEIATRLVPNLQNNMLMVESADGQLLTTASFSTTPEVGMSPVEIFGNESPVGDRGTNVHFGSTITEINPLTETTTTEGTANAQTTETVTPETESETPAIQVIETPPVGGGLINTGTLAGGVAVTGTATEAAAPRVEDGETYVAAAVTGTPFTATLLRGQGREDSPYNSLGAQVPILGQGSYTTPDRAYAEYFGPNVTEQTVTLQNPLVISNDDQWRALTKEAGWAFSNPFGQDIEKITSDIATLRSQLEAKGYDGVVIQVPASELTGKTLGKVFGASQVIVFNPPTAGGVPTVETPVSINDITDLVIAKKVSGLAALTQQLTGKAQLEELNPAELTAVHDALTMDTHPLPLPSHMASVSQELYGVPAAVEAAKTERDNRPITDQVNERGVGETPEMSMDALTAAKANIGKLNGQLAGGAKTGATAGGLLEAWSGYHRVLNDILASRRENPKLWADYAERQAQVAQLNVGDTALSATPSTDNPFGQPVTILKKNPKTWSVQDAGGTTLNVLPVTLRPVAVAPVVETPIAGTPAGGAPTAGTPTGGASTGGMPTGGTPTGGTPASEIKADTPITPRQSKLRWEAEKPGVEAIHTTLAEVPHIITPEGAFHYVRDAAAPKKLVLTAGFASPEAQAAYEKETAAAAQKKITEELDKEPMKVAIDTADAAAVAELIYGKTVEDEFLPIIFSDEKLIRMAVDPAQLNAVEAALSKYGFRITDRSVPVKTDDPAATGPERVSVSALYRPGRTDIQAGGAQFIHNRKGATTAPPVPKDPTDGQIDKMLKAVDKDTLFDINLGTFGAVMFKEGMVVNIKDATDYLNTQIRKQRYFPATTGNRQVIRTAVKEGIDVAAMLDKYVAAANKLQGIFNASENVANLVAALNTAYVADIFGATNIAKYTADGLALRGQMVDQKLAEYIDRMRYLFLADENSSNQAKRIVKKDADVPPQLGNIIRRGMRDHRQGRDVSVDDFLTTFGFFPGGFSPGDWVTQIERAAHLNAVYDALYDLADLSGVNPIMLGLGQKLKLAIGAQGRGGKTAAHYWKDTNEINLTKTKGDGTVAHEWNHGLDHNLRLASKYGSLLMDDTVAVLRNFMDASRVENVLRGVLRDTANNPESRNVPPKQAFFDMLPRNIYNYVTDSTSYFTDAKKLDEGSNEPYYSTPHEMLSRAFESMLFDASKGGTPYLVGPSRADGYMSLENGYAAAPYPTKTERVRLNAEFKTMLDQIDPQTLAVKTYVAELRIVEIEGLGFAIVDQHNLGTSHGKLVWLKTRADAESNLNYGGGERILTPLKLQIGKVNAIVIDMAQRVDAIMEEMGLFKWPEVKNGSMAESMFFHMRQGWWPKNNAELAEYAGKAFILQPKLLGYDPDTAAGRKSIEEFKPARLDRVKLKQAQEDFEAAAARYVGQVTSDMRAAGSDDAAIYQHIVGLYRSQPTLEMQTTTSLANQAYSTPLPIAYVAGLLARVTVNTTVLEPTAGNGLLAMTANVKNVIAMELEPHRAANLKLMEFGRVEQGNALKLMEGIRDQETDVVLANPPFNTLPSPEIVPSWTGEGYRIAKLEHLIAAKSLRSMANGGRAVLIVSAQRNPGAITTPDRVFLNWLYSNYNVADHFEVAGNLYRKEGASAPIRVLVIAGRNQTESAFPPDFVISRVNTFDELWSRYVQARDNSEKVLVGTGKAQPKVGGGNILPGGLRTGNTSENGNVGGQGGVGGSISNGQPNQPGGRGTITGGTGGLGTSGQPNAGELTSAGNGQVGVTGEGETSQQGGRNVRGKGSADAELGGLSNVDIDDIFAELEKPKRAPKSTGPKVPGAPSAPRAPRGPRKLELTGDAEIDAIFADLNAALNGTPPAAPQIAINKPKKPQSKLAEEVTRAYVPKITPLLLTYNPSAANISYAAVDQAIQSQNNQIREALTRLARQADTENKGGNDDPASGLYSRKGEINYADVKPILQRLYDAYLPKYDSFKALVVGMYENLKKLFGEAILPHLRAFVDDMRVQVVERPANQTPIQTEPVDTESQVVYYGKSRYNSEGVYLPKSQAKFTYAALENLEAQEGDIDEFVARELGYASTDEMAIGLAGFQIDALALAISANKMGKGFVVGDDTGVGKGRTAAAMLVWAKKNGKIPIFMTLNTALYSDMYRDLKAIGHGGMRIGMTDTDSDVIEDLGGGRSRKLFENKKGDGSKLVNFLTKNGALPPNIDVVFTTYTQLGGNGSAGRQAAIASLVGSGKAALVMDEAHNAAGESKTNKYFMSLLTGEGLFGKDAAGGVNPIPADWAPPPTLYLSATFAKRPDNMPLYIHTNLRYAADTPDELKDLFGKGAGTDVLQQIASEMLVKSGSMIRRERSYIGVKMNFVEEGNPSDAREVDNITTALRALVTADRSLKEWLKQPGVKASIVRDLGPAGSSFGKVGDAFNDVKHQSFSSVVHNYIGQLLLATKIKAAVDATVEKMNNGEKVTLALQNTMGAVLDAYVEKKDLSPGDDLTDLGWQTVLRRGVDSTLKVTLKSPSGLLDTKVYILFDMLPPSVRAEYARVEALIAAFQSPLPVSPIDAIRQQLETKFVWTEDGTDTNGNVVKKVKVGDTPPAGVAARHLVVREISGRANGIDYRHDVPRYMKLEDPDRVAVIAGFNNGDKAQKTGPVDVLILTAAGATGISLHASVDVFDQRDRHMIILQPHADISVFKQLLGRIHRTGQISWPSFTMLASGIPAERRTMAIIKKKMASLVSNTSAGSSATSMKGVDFINQYGDVSVARYLNDHSDIRVFLDYAPWPDVEAAAGRDVALKASGTASLLPVADQQEFFDSVEADYNSEIERRNATGTNALLRSVYPFNATLEESTMLDEGLNPDNPFTEGVAMDRYAIDIVGEIPSQAKVEDAIRQALAGRTARAVVDQIDSDLKVAYDEANNQLVSQQRRLQTEAAAPNITDKQKLDIEAQLKAMTSRVDGFAERRDKTLTALRDSYAIGSGYGTFELNSVPSSAVVVSYTVTKSQSKTGNPYAPSNFKINFMRNLPRGRVPVSLATLEGTTITQADYDSQPNLSDWFVLRSVTGGRTVAYIATGNILRAAKMLDSGWEVANFTLDTGSEMPGLLMPQNYQPGSLPQLPYAVRTPAAAAQVALSAWSALLAEKFAGTGISEYADALLSSTQISFTQALPDVAVVQKDASHLLQGKNGSWAMILDKYTPRNGYVLQVLAKDKALASSKELLALLKGNDMTRPRNATVFTSSAHINDPKQIEQLVRFLHKQSPAIVSPDLAPFAKEVVKADFDLAEAKRGLPSRAGVVTGGQTAEAVRSQLVTLEGINVQVVQSTNQLPEASAPSDVEGVWYSGTTVYLVADNLPNATRVQQVLAHEAIGHAAMEAMLGPKLMAELINNVQNLEKTGHRLTRDVAAQVDRTQPGLSADRRAKEIIAVMAERGEHVKGVLWQRAIYAVRQWLRSKGFDIAFSESDVLAALRDAETFAKRGPSLESPSRRRFVIGMAATLASTQVQAGGVTRGKASPVPDAVLRTPVSSSVEKILRGGAKDGATALRAAVSEIAKSGPAELRALAAEIEKLLPTSGLALRVNDTDRMNAHGAVTYGGSSPAMTMYTAGGLRGLSHEVVLHEALHVAVLARYEALSTSMVRSNDKILGMSAPEAAAAMKQFRSLWAEFKVEAGLDPGMDARTKLSVEEARSSPDEFFARALTDGVFQKYLSSKDYQGQTLLKRFKDWVTTSLFGFGNKSGVTPSWLDAALAASSDLTSAMPRDKADYSRADATRNYFKDRQQRAVSASMLNAEGPAPSGVAAAVANAFPQYSIRSVTNDAIAYGADLLHTDETFNRWHRTIGTPFHKAYVSPAYREVYVEGQKFVRDITAFAHAAADEALSLLPRIEQFRDFGKKSPSEADVKAAMAATMAGTLYGGGSPLQGRKWNAGELAAGRADDALPGTAQAFTPLTPYQIKLYFEGQAAVGVALDNFTKGVIHRLTSRHGVAFDVEMSLEDGAELVREQLQEKADQQTLLIDTLRQGFGGLNPQNPRDVTKRNRLVEQIATAESQRAVFEGLVSEVTVVEDRATSMKDHGYFPAMRFGRFAVYITHEDPVTQAVSQVYFGLFENQTKANLAAMALAKEYPGDKITRGVVSQEQYALFQGLSLDALENFADHITDTNGNAISKDPLVQGFLKAAVAERSALKRQIHRKGVAGYSDDMTRVLSNYILSMSRTASGYFHSAEMSAYAMSIKDGAVKDEAIKLITYLKNPVEESSKIRGFLATEFILGSVAYGVVNAAAPAMMTIPYLTRYTSPANAIAKVRAAAFTNVNKLTGDVRDDYLRAKKEGVVAPQEIHQLRAESDGAPIFGKNLAWRKFSFAWGFIASATEQMNRTTTFLAAYNIAKENGHANPYELAVDVVNQTQMVYNKGNRSNWGQGPIGAILFIFKHFPISFMELAKRMYDIKDSNGKHNFTPLALLVFMVLVGGGAEGLPGAENVEDVLDTIGQWLGFATNTKKGLHDFLAKHLGEEWGRVAARGVSGFSKMPVDLSVRFGFGRIIPGTAMLKPSETNKEKALLELVGPIGQFVPFKGTMAGKAFEKLREVDFGAGLGTTAMGVADAALEVAPIAVQNLKKGIQMAYTGQYPDARNRQGIEVDKWDAALKAASLQPSSVARETLKDRDRDATIAIQKQVESDIARAWAVAIVAENEKGQARAEARVKEWNAENPDLPIEITYAQVKAIRDTMITPRDTRIIRNAPRELRGSVAQDLAR